MKNFIYRSILVVIFVVVLDFALGKAMQYLLHNQKSGDYYYIHKTLVQTKDDILILGSSRANHHYSPDIISEKLNRTCFNAGKDAQGIYYSYAVLSSILPRYSPGLIICDLSPNVFVDPEQLKKLNVIIPYRDQFPVINEFIQLMDSPERVKLNSSLYPYNSKYFDLMSGYVRPAKSQTGYKPLTGTINPVTFKEIKPDFENTDTLSFYFLKKFCSLTKSKNISVVFVISPMYVKDDKKNVVISKLQELVGSYDYKILDYSLSPNFMNKEFLFRDQIHLNSKGAELFTGILCDSLASLNYKKNH